MKGLVGVSAHSATFKAEVSEVPRAGVSDELVVLYNLRSVWVQGPRGKLSQDLVALWGDGSPAAARLLKRTFPPGLLRFLSAPRPQQQLPPPPPSMLLPPSLRPSLQLRSQASAAAAASSVGAASDGVTRQAGVGDLPAGSGGGGSSSVRSSPRGSEVGSVAATKQSVDGSVDGPAAPQQLQARDQQRRRRSGVQFYFSHIFLAMQKRTAHSKVHTTLHRSTCPQIVCPQIVERVRLTMGWLIHLMG